MKRITARFVLLIATAGVLPLLLYGVVSINSLRSGTDEEIRQGNIRVAEQVAEQVAMFMEHNTRVLESLGTELGATGLERWQQERILKDYFLQFHEFREITAFDRSSRPLATSAMATTRLKVPEAALQLADRPFVAPLRVDSDFLPITTIAVPI